jgi:hypothetical protein
VSSPFRVPGAKLTLFVALMMTMIGFAGVFGSISALTSSIDIAYADSATPPEVAAASEAFMRAFLSSPLRRAVAVANLLASGLLVVASFLLTSRSPSAPWWVAQALWANAAYSIGAGAANVYLVQVHRPELMEFLHAALEAQAVAGEPVPASGVDGMPQLIVLFTIGWHVLLAGLYVLLLRLTRRDDVRRFIAREV